MKPTLALAGGCPLVLALSAVVASGASAQHTHGHAAAATLAEPGAVQFIREARLGTARYRDRRAAIADGYRRLGPAFPGMGEHWVHPGLIVSGRFEAGTPSVLCYADSAGMTTLIGVAYAVPVRPGEAPPPAPAGDDVWHEHSDAVDDETLLLIHPAAQEGDGSQPRLAMFHAWIWLDNPDGVFAQNNWALPFAQLGLHAPPDVTPAAAHAASLLTVGETYYMQLLDVLARPEPAERRIFENAVQDALASARMWRASIPSGPLDVDDIVALEQIWIDLWLALDAAAGAATRARLREYAGRPERMSSGDARSVDTETSRQFQPLRYEPVDLMVNGDPAGLPVQYLTPDARSARVRVSLEELRDCIGERCSHPRLVIAAQQEHLREHRAPLQIDVLIAEQLRDVVEEALRPE